jgi:hypothetical protein
MSRGFVAQFLGRCTECEEIIEVGDLILGAAGSGYQHIECVELDDDEESPVPEPEEKPTKFQGTSLDEMGF